MRHLSNILNPEAEDAKEYLCYSFHAMQAGAQRDREWQQHLSWVNKNLIGLPKATASYTVEELIAMGMVGLYAE